MLEEWAVPDHILAGAPASPYYFDPQVFTDAADAALDRTEDTPSDRVAREALPPGGAVLDVGCGAGAASFRLRPGRVVGVDQSGPLLEAFRQRAARLGIPAVTVEGRWPDAAAEVAEADVVVCHHVVYNVPDLVAFLRALDAAARARVVVELTAVHPMAWTAPYWQALHGLGRPDRPGAADAVAVMHELGFDVSYQRWERNYQMIGENADDAVTRTARRLCLPASRHDELRRLMAATPPPAQREVVTVWWGQPD